MFGQRGTTFQDQQLWEQRSLELLEQIMIHLEDSIDDIEKKVEKAIFDPAYVHRLGFILKGSEIPPKYILELSDFAYDYNEIRNSERAKELGVELESALTAYRSQVNTLFHLYKIPLRQYLLGIAFQKQEAMKEKKQRKRDADEVIPIDI